MKPSAHLLILFSEQSFTVGQSLTEMQQNIPSTEKQTVQMKQQMINHYPLLFFPLVQIYFIWVMRALDYKHAGAGQAQIIL